jgi:hypothetical protein
LDRPATAEVIEESEAREARIARFDEQSLAGLKREHPIRSLLQTIPALSR